MYVNTDRMVLGFVLCTQPNLPDGLKKKRHNEPKGHKGRNICIN
jgi:hypothetical protein